MELPENLRKLKELLPILEEKCKQGLIKNDSHRRAVSLVAWVEDRGLVLTPSQDMLVGKLIERATRRHRRGAPITINQNTTVVNEADADAIVGKVVAKVGALLDTDTVARRVLDKIQNSGEAETMAELVEKRVMRALEQRAPRRVEVTVKHPDGKSAKVKGDQHQMFERLLRAGTSRLPNGYAPGIFLAGEASSGKTTGCRMLAEALKLDWYFNGAITLPHEMLGFIDGHGKYHGTPFRQAYEHGGVYTFDEVDRSDPNALLAVNPHLANGIATFPDKQIKRHRDCVIICTANTWGLGADADYSGATKLDAAFLSRFPIRISWDIDPVLEEKIVGNAEWLARVRNARKRARAVGLKVMIDTRIAQAGAALIETGYSHDEAAAMTYLANVKPDQRQLLGA